VTQLSLYIRGHHFVSKELIMPEFITVDLLHRAQLKTLYIERMVAEMKVDYWKQISNHSTEYEFYLEIKP